MGEVRFMISEAAKQVHVESHVLRYWEEELDLTIGRTEMGHRYYTEDDIQLFRCIKKLKNEGMLLKDLKPLIPKLKETRNKLTAVQAESAQTSSPEDKTVKNTLTKNTLIENSLAASPSSEALKSETKPSAVPTATDSSDSTAITATEAEVIPITQLEQVRNLIGDVLTEVVTTNNHALETSISRKVTADVIREMDFLFQAKERQEEEHYRKLDCLIRQQQANRKELAEKETPFEKLKKILT